LEWCEILTTIKQKPVTSEIKTHCVSTVQALERDK
jgi:hypothetical protein